MHGYDRRRRSIRTRQHDPLADLQLLLGDGRLLPASLLDMEQQWMAIQLALPRFRWRWSRPYRIGLVGTCLCLCIREAQAS